jgi:hypothetical protein
MDPAALQASVLKRLLGEDPSAQQIAAAGSASGHGKGTRSKASGSHHK